MIRLNRRAFLKLLGLAGTGTLGCSQEPARALIPYIVPPESVIPGRPSWFATTCRECPAGCGMLAKNRDGRVIKVEGNPLHPVNAGVLCPRGQASLTRLYNPDRIRGPMKRTASGGFKEVSWQEAEDILLGGLKRAAEKGEKGRLVFMTGLITGTLAGLVEHWSSLSGGGVHLPFEPFDYGPLKEANRIVFGREIVPSYRIDEADFLISFGAGFLETWISNVEYARQFARFHETKNGKKGFFVFVGPRQSMTAANADHRVEVRPGDEYLVALALLQILSEKHTPEPPEGPDLRRLMEGHSPADIFRHTGLSEQEVREIARRFAEARRPLALAEGLTWFSPSARETAVAANLLNARHPGSRGLVQWSRRSAQSDIVPAEELRSVFDRMRNKEVDLFLFHDANPVFSLPNSWDAAGALEAVPMVVSFSSLMDETAALADLILPAHTPLESWGDYSPREGVAGIMQPVMGHLHNTAHLGDLLIRLGKRAFGPDRFPWADFYGLLRGSWMQGWRDSGADVSYEAFWTQILQKGGHFTGIQEQGVTPRSGISFSFPPLRRGDEDVKEKRFRLVVYPTIQFYDGRQAASPWIQELPDPITQATWGGWAEIHPDAARDMGVKRGDLLEIESESGVIRIPALPIYTVDRETIAVPLGQGHTSHGRFASGLPANPMALFPPGTKGRGPVLVKVQKGDKPFPIAVTAGSLFEHGRHIVETTELKRYREDVSSHKKPDITLPLPSGWDPKRDFYDPHAHSPYRWSMVVDLDRCIGCGACVVACYAENNVAFVEREQVLAGREMSWIRVQRYFSKDGRRVHWLVMLCQHCDSAPCESVCPVYAPHHSIEGLNNQVYNRCFGTRFCSQNDPYKVRRFNWFTWTRPWPLNMQLNPDVTVRQKGVMEKCSFCIQRIVNAKIQAREKGRVVKDGDFTTACAQTCPTNALVFGNLKDPESRVSKLINDPRAYQALHHLNTKPAVIYLKKIEQGLGV